MGFMLESEPAYRIFDVCHGVLLAQLGACRRVDFDAISARFDSS
jgi:hypothetical protein